MLAAFKALSDPNRRKIVELLSEQDRTVTEIAEHFTISQPSISQHLALLKSSGLLEARKEGKYIVYSLNMTVFQEVLKWMLTVMHKGEERS
ncbi:ArsR family transcriptional regulator [Fictibacillus macauensis ZFHKF-1]|uniref:ArsR family transcriptional regulator n=1 Tax=Fictibacillus macauensis ZFHKF-1 TaxID=1196324 RepID=I8IZR7_9BACL|nr:autorepressor SdpR family transcription factor [Fictibacillus macauensis]EIT84961.1 ArsR family transcriptional regulator [Fictibacillus macauensis ZFHKF-1]